MTGLLQKAMHRAEALPQEEQDAIAAQILQLMDSDEAWDRSFAANPEKLRRMAEEAIAEYERGETLPLEDLLGE